MDRVDTKVTEPLTPRMKDVLVAILTGTPARATGGNGITLWALRRRGLLSNFELTPEGKSAATQIKRTRDRDERWKDRD